MCVRACVIFTLFFLNIPNLNRGDPDQIPRSMASDLGILCLALSYFWDAIGSFLTVMPVSAVFHINIFSLAGLEPVRKRYVAH